MPERKPTKQGEKHQIKSRSNPSGLSNTQLQPKGLFNGASGGLKNGIKRGEPPQGRGGSRKISLKNNGK